MYSLYEGSVKVGFESKTVYELLDKLPDTKGEEEFGAESFHGDVFAYDHDEWADWINFLLHDEGGLAMDLEDGETTEELLSGWLRDRKLPRELRRGQTVVCIDGGGDLEEFWHVFDGDPDVETINDMLNRCMPDYGYRIVAERP